MINNFGKFVPLTLVLLFSFGCVSLPPVNFSAPNIGVSSTKLDAELKSLTVSVARPDEATGEIDPALEFTQDCGKHLLRRLLTEWPFLRMIAPGKFLWLLRY